VAGISCSDMVVNFLPIAIGMSMVNEESPEV
jgi:hypothetical protein